MDKKRKLTNLPPPYQANRIKDYSQKKSNLPPPPISDLPLFNSYIEKEVQGIGMGVLENGIPYLTGAGLAKMCDIEEKTLRELANSWETEQNKPRGKIIKEILNKNKYYENKLFIPIVVNNSIHHAYPEVVCITLLEYYAFHSNTIKEKARENLILLARKTFKDFIYYNTGYTPETKILNEWKYFLDRVDLNYDSVPRGYFSIFKESAGLTASLIKNKVIINDHTIADGSIGGCWGRYWTDNKLDEKYGQRIKYEHNYPDYYPQAKSNPQPACAYPDEALAFFRQWFELEYIFKKFPIYLLKKVKSLHITNEHREKVLLMVQDKTIEKNKENIKLSSLNKSLKQATEYNPNKE